MHRTIHVMDSGGYHFENQGKVFTKVSTKVFTKVFTKDTEVLKAR